MYLYRREMVLAIKEAVRMTKPGGSLCFTHFVEVKGKRVGSIIQKVDKSYWISQSDVLGIEKVQFFNIKYHRDRYGFVCNKKQ